jgi:hypothetical protein
MFTEAGSVVWCPQSNSLLSTCMHTAITKSIICMKWVYVLVHWSVTYVDLEKSYNGFLSSLALGENFILIRTGPL